MISYLSVSEGLQVPERGLPLRSLIPALTWSLGTVQPRDPRFLPPPLSFACAFCTNVLERLGEEFQQEAEGPRGPGGRGARPVSFVEVKGLQPGPGPTLTCSSSSGKRWVYALLLQDLLPAPTSAPSSHTGLPSLGQEDSPGSPWGAQWGGARPGWASRLACPGPGFNKLRERFSKAT